MKVYKDSVEAANALNEVAEQLRQEIGKVIVGQRDVVDGVLLSIFCNGHSLLIGVPGLAKTLLIKTISDVLDLSFHRIQFTPDLMPSDITGSEVLDDNRNFRFSRGPLFANIILADEINRTPPKTQAALLEAMQEKNVTVNGQVHELPKPFFVLATQNPIEQEGTYPLPEAQLDRFMFNIILDYPSERDEIEIVRSTTGNSTPDIHKIIGSAEILAFQKLVREVPIADNVLEYAVKLVGKTRPGAEGASEFVQKYLNYGAGPRASQYLVLGAKCHSLLRGKYSPDIEDVQAIATNVLRHRIVKNYRAEAEGISVEDIIRKLM
ncbi:MAG: AAA family ATPase [Flavobacteriales bacterium]|nr:AAA family ATPase [Flavobacteriales bacterium]